MGTALGRSDSWVSWTEQGHNDALSVSELAAMLSCVGLDLSLRTYPQGGGLRDAGQAEVLGAFRDLVVPPWSWATEVPMPIPGDLRAWDCVLSRPRCRIGVDAETRLTDAQAVDRRVMLKLRDSAVDRAIIVLPDTRSNRDALRAISPAVLANYPVRSAAALEALREGRDPGGNALVVVGRPGQARSRR